MDMLIDFLKTTYEKTYAEELNLNALISLKPNFYQIEEYMQLTTCNDEKYINWNNKVLTEFHNNKNHSGAILMSDSINYDIFCYERKIYPDISTHTKIIKTICVTEEVIGERFLFSARFIQNVNGIAAIHIIVSVASICLISELSMHEIDKWTHPRYQKCRTIAKYILSYIQENYTLSLIFLTLLHHSQATAIACIEKDSNELYINNLVPVNIQEEYSSISIPILYKILDILCFKHPTIKLLKPISDLNKSIYEIIRSTTIIRKKYIYLMDVDENVVNIIKIKPIPLGKNWIHSKIVDFFNMFEEIYNKL